METKKWEHATSKLIINAIKDEKSLELFNIIGGSKRHSSEVDLSHRGYYRKHSRLIVTGLVKRERDRRKYALTALGIIVHRGQLILQNAVSIYWNLKAIDAIVSSGKYYDKIATNELTDFVDVKLREE